MLEIAGPRSGATGRACEETGIATAAPSSRATKMLDLNMVGLVLVANRTTTAATGSIIPGARPRSRRLFPERHHDRVVVAEHQVDAVRVVHDAGNPVRRRDRTKAARQIFLTN